MRKVQTFDKVKELSTLIAVVANDRTLGLTLNERGLCYIDYEKRHIVLSDRLIPKPLRKHPKIVDKFRQALAQHEAQHWVFAKNMMDDQQRWINSRRHPDLAHLLNNIVEDYRVNTWLAETYSWDIGQRVEWMVYAFGKSWEYTLSKMLKKAVKDGNDDMLLDPLAWLNQGIVFCGLYGVDVERYREMWAEVTGDYGPDDFVEQIKETVEKVWEAKYTPSDRILELSEKVYADAAFYARDWFERVDVKGDKWKHLKLKKNARPPSACGHSSADGEGRISPGGGGGGVVNTKMIPEHLGGSAELDADPKQVAGGELGDTQPDSPGEAYATVAGKGAGLETPSPEPNEGKYLELVNRNMPHITSLLNKMKRLMQPKLRILKYQKSGKIMSKQLAKMAVQRRPVEHIYTRKRFYTQKYEVKMTLVVDMSGSMNTEQARDALTTIAEVGGRWLHDGDMAVFVFGSGYKKVKAFGESYRNTRARIGGVHCMGGTELGPCLSQVHRMHKAYIGNHRQVVIIVSDFCVFDPEEVKKHLKLMRRDAIIPVGVGYCGTRLDDVKEYTGKNSTYVRQVSELPERFFDIFRRASL